MTHRAWTRAVLPISAVSLLLLVIAIGSAWYIRKMQKDSVDMLAEHLTSMRAAQELEQAIRDVRTQGVRYLVLGSPKHLEPIPLLKERVMAALVHAETLAYTPEEQALMRRVRAGLETFFIEYEVMTRGNPIRAEYQKTLDLVDTVLANEVIEPTQEYLRQNERMLVRANRDNQAVASQITRGLVALGLCGAAGGLLGGWALAFAQWRAMTQAEERLRSTARQLDQAARSADDVPPREGRGTDALDDVTESAAAVLARLKRTEREALRAEQLAWVGQMAAGIAHEVRNPLMAIKLLIQAAADGRSGERLKPRDFRVLEEEIIRLEGIISSFLDFARPPRPDKHPVELGPLVAKIVQSIRPRTQAQGVVVEIRVDEPVVADADANHLRQVFYNLFLNALDAQPVGGRVRVIVSRSAIRAEATIRVEDDGPGLPPTLREEIFDPFVSTKESGMGLGLSICRRIVEDHGGVIRAENREGGGAAFTISLPLGQAAGRLPVAPGSAPSSM